MSVASYSAAENLSNVARQMGKWLDRILGPEYHRFRPGESFHPAVNLYEDADAFHLVVDLSGVDAKAIDLKIENRQLVVSGQRQAPRPPSCQEGPSCERPLRLHVMEIDHGPFSRTLQLPSEAADDVKLIEACYRNGFLWIKLPKKN